MYIFDKEVKFEMVFKANRELEQRSDISNLEWFMFDS